MLRLRRKPKPPPGVKPKIQRVAGYLSWQCSDGRVVGYGMTPETAYRDWLFWRRWEEEAVR